MHPLLLTDFYKVGHPFQYPKGTTKVYSNLTPRKSRIPGVDKMVFFGLQYFMLEYLIAYFNHNFFGIPKKYALNSYKRIIKNTLGSDLPTYEHIEKLHDLGYLPIEIKALPEGTIVPMKVPVLTIVNTLPEFYWVTNFIESLMSAIIWQPCTSATIAHEYHKIFTKWNTITGMDPAFIQWQGHDFSFRGMSSLESAITSGMGHLLSFTGTDTIPAIMGMEEYYGADIEKELVGGSVPATEHSVMCAGAKESEWETIDRILFEIYPTGIVSVVCDTWDLWKVLTEYCVSRKDRILARDGKFVIRPDSGDPVDIICGINSVSSYTSSTEILERLSRGISLPAWKGVIELLWDVFGGTVNEKGYKVLDPHVGAIYGDSITLDVAKRIAERLEAKGFAFQPVLGIGSFTYQYNTRDTFGLAMKATYVEINHEGREIFKDPITDDGTKKSAKGLLRVEKVAKPGGGYELKLIDQCTPEMEAGGELKTVFKDGIITKFWTLKEIRETLSKQ